MLQQNISANFLFSPQFNYYFDFDPLAEVIIIRSVFSQESGFTTQSGREFEGESSTRAFKVIPKDLISLPKGCVDDSSNQILQKLARDICFVNENLIRILNKEGLDCLIFWRDMKVLGYSKFMNDQL